jgi:hypothetical protein
VLGALPSFVDGASASCEGACAFVVSTYFTAFTLAAFVALVFATSVAFIVAATVLVPFTETDSPSLAGFSPCAAPARGDSPFYFFSVWLINLGESAFHFISVANTSRFFFVATPSGDLWPVARFAPLMRIERDISVGMGY